MAKIIFIPFSNNEGNTGERADANSWQTNIGGYHIVCYDGNHQHPIQTAGMFDEIYLIGHGGAGLDYIQSDKGTALRYDVVADRLIASGLAAMYAGDVKIYACHSGEASGSNLSFAKHFARYLIKDRGRYLAAVYGYSGRLTARVFHEQTIGLNPDLTAIEVAHKKHHKWSKTNVGQPNETWTKAKNKRERFYGLV